MSWNIANMLYEPTTWPAAYDGADSLPGETLVNFNLVEFDIIKPSQKRKDNIAFFTPYKYLFPSSLVQDTYFSSLDALKGTLDLYLNQTKLELNTHYTYSYTTKKFRLIHIVPEDGKETVGVLYAKYIPATREIRYSDLDIATLNKKYNVNFRRESTGFFYEMMSKLRTGIEDAWAFMLKEKPLWIGGADNQNFGSNSLIKYITPISLTHIIEVGEEIIALNDYINLKFKHPIEIDFVLPTDSSSLMTEDLIKKLMIALNSIETILDELGKDPANANSLAVK
jgi:hypothetical protein